MTSKMASRNPSSDSLTVTNKHKVGYSASWTTDFPWHVPVYDTSSTESTVVGLLCSLCKQHNTKQRNTAELGLQNLPVSLEGMYYNVIWTQAGRGAGSCKAGITTGRRH